MPRQVKTSSDTKKKETAWEESGLTAVEQSQAHFLVLQLANDGKFEAQTGALANKHNVARVVGGMSL